MTITPISDLQDPRLEAYRVVSDAELLRSRGFFVAEGRLVVERVLADVRYRVESLLLNSASLKALGPALASSSFGGPVYLYSSQDFETLTGFNMHRGCLAIVRRPAAVSWQEAAGDSRLIVVLEGITNADNVGGVFRNAAAFGAGAVLLSPACCDPLYRKSVRTSMGAVLTVPFARLAPWPDGIDLLHGAGFTVVALSPREPAVRLDAFATSPLPVRLALLVGTEGAGLSADAERRVDTRVRISITGKVDSLNLAVATGIALARLCSDG